MATRMKLADFYKYVRQNRKRISDIYREIEEIQYQFNELYTRQQEERNKLIAAYAPQLLPEAAEDLPPQLRQLLQAQAQTERQALKEEIATLESDIADKRQKADKLIMEAQRQVAYLREQNPILDQQEEELKARRALMEREIEHLDAELKHLSWFPIGWLTNFFKRRRLRRQCDQLAENLGSMNSGIRKVRETWQAEKTRLQEAQIDLQGQWQVVSVETSQLQARLDYLVTNIDEQSMQNATFNLLSNMQELPVGEGAWRDHLQPLVELTLSQAQYETSLRSVAEILGLLKGLAEGMDRFIRSVSTVYEEQRRYKLPSLTVNLSAAVTSFHAVWPEFQAKVKDEKYLGTQPVEFERRIRDIVSQRLGEAAIQRMFNHMGDALTRATEAWQ